MYKYAFRAECFTDAFLALDALMQFNMSRYLINQTSPDFPDVEVEFTCNLPLPCVRDRLRTVEDGHTMVETVALAINYTGERVPVEPSLAPSRGRVATWLLTNEESP